MLQHVACQILVLLRSLVASTGEPGAADPARLGICTRDTPFQIADLVEENITFATLLPVAQGTAIIARGTLSHPSLAQELPRQVCVVGLCAEIWAHWCGRGHALLHASHAARIGICAGHIPFQVAAVIQESEALAIRPLGASRATHLWARSRPLLQHVASQILVLFGSLVASTGEPGAADPARLGECA